MKEEYIEDMCASTTRGFQSNCCCPSEARGTIFTEIKSNFDSALSKDRCVDTVLSKEPRLESSTDRTASTVGSINRHKVN